MSYKEDLGTWYEHLEPHLHHLTSIWDHLKIRTAEGARIIPKQDNIFNAFKHCSYDDIKVVILGQDCYHTIVGDLEVANGFAFSSGVSGYTPPSLRNIITELEVDVYSDNGFDPERLELSDNDAWGVRQADQGVLLLNTALTVEESNPGCHISLWEPFVNEVITHISSNKENIVWILWGKYAEKYKELIDETKHHIIISPHPSPFSARTGFFGSRPFTKCNRYLTQHGIKPIKW
jgi:uracil-DNA glycosylase